MTILVTGSTGVIGTQVLEHLQGSGASVRALTRSPERAQFPAGVEAIKGELGDIGGLRNALQDVDTLFLLAPNAADELTQALQALSIARESGVRGIVYLSVFKGEAYADVPHFTSKHAVERMIEQAGLPATVLRPAYFMQNDASTKDALLKHGVFGMPIGAKGISMVDVRDIGDAATRELLRRERSAEPLPPATYELVGPDALTADSIVAIWSDALNREIRYGGDDLDALETRMKGAGPEWLAYDIRLMMQRYQQDGAVANAHEIERLSQLLGRPPRTYRDFAAECAQQWASE